MKVYLARVYGSGGVFGVCTTREAAASLVAQACQYASIEEHEVQGALVEERTKDSWFWVRHEGRLTVGRLHWRQRTWELIGSAQTYRFGEVTITSAIPDLETP